MCEELQRDLGEVITLPSDKGYQTLSTENWSQTSWQKPSCIATPQSVSQVQSIFLTLRRENVPFAVRSGGHSPAPFDSNINTGVLISLAKLNGMSYDEVRQTATIGPGARWGQVYAALDPFNVTVVGGRVGDVGVGGLVLGSGLSYLSNLYGLACDNVLEYKVVLANGTLVVASATSHPDLFWALKGGANNFGIVTEFTVATYPIKEAWGGLRTYTIEQMPQVLEALNQYQTAEDKDPYANLFISIPITNATEYGILVTFVYLKPVIEPAAYAGFYDIEASSDATALTTLNDLMTSFPSLSYPRYNWYTNTYQPTSSLYSRIGDLLSTADEVGQVRAVTGGTLVATFQPIDASVGAFSQPSVSMANQRYEKKKTAGEETWTGGNALGLQAVPQTWMALQLLWWGNGTDNGPGNGKNDDAVVDAAAHSLNERITGLAHAEGAFLDYIFMNDASWTQPVIASYGKDNVHRLTEVQQQYDPEKVFTRLLKGGQKIPEGFE
ncbi:hypothetical protein C7999DRAFT_13716 [Corynascus novoguineensis]|uniref:FAD-binding PCMH-type domain-containing protein n=1 Tax=Corynascus novoguineensis TaxID=1126955 RepID=A0AAN7CU15_9PEZI|nr:hypothetical protein C7999DRAFT_13716 [Corynascus novoguineensis]